MAELNFNAENVEPQVALEVVPKGDYLAIMTQSELKDTRAGTGQYLQCVWEIVDGEQRGRLLWDRLNLKNPNATAVKIAESQLSAICHAVGVMRPKDSTELHGKPVLLKVTVEPRDDKPGSFKNEIKGYSSPKGSTAPVAAKPAATATTTASVPPWKRTAA